MTAAAAELEYHRMMLEEQKYVYYGRVVRQGGWTILQYWFFYCYNSWRSGYEGANDHESDWENIRGIPVRGRRSASSGVGRLRVARFSRR